MIAGDAILSWSNEEWNEPSKTSPGSARSWTTQVSTTDLQWIFVLSSWTQLERTWPYKVITSRGFPIIIIHGEVWTTTAGCGSCRDRLLASMVFEDCRVSLIPRASHCPVLDCSQYQKLDDRKVLEWGYMRDLVYCQTNTTWVWGPG